MRPFPRPFLPQSQAGGGAAALPGGVRGEQAPTVNTRRFMGVPTQGDPDLHPFSPSRYIFDLLVCGHLTQTDSYQFTVTRSYPG